MLLCLNVVVILMCCVRNITMYMPVILVVFDAKFFARNIISCVAMLLYEQAIVTCLCTRKESTALYVSFAGGSLECLM